MKQNPVGWFEIYVNEMPRAKAFYEAVFGTQLSLLTSDGLEMWSWPMEGEGPGATGALVKMEGCPAGGNSTIVYFSCDDCAKEETLAASNGGQVFKPKFSIGEYGFISLVADTEGNVIGLHSMK